MKYNDNGLWKTLNVKVTDTLPVGTIIPYAGSTVPSNYMKCEGQELSRIEYDILFSAIGTTYGVGDGTTTFNLPNLKGRVITGIDSNDTDFDTLGETGGEKTHTLNIDEMPSHAHEQLAISNPDSGGSGIRGTYNGQEGDGMSRYPTNAQTGTTGGGEAHNNLQPYIVLNYIIKVLDAPATQAQVFDRYSTSSRDSYSCDYINKLHKYTSEEHIVGKTEDGKNVYAKDILLGDLEAGVEKEVSTGVNIDKLFNFYGFYKFAGFNIPVNYYNYTDNQGGYCYPDYINSNIKIRSSYGGTDCFVTLIYTKTTD